MHKQAQIENKSFAASKKPPTSAIPRYIFVWERTVLLVSERIEAALPAAGFSSLLVEAVVPDCRRSSRRVGMVSA